MKPSQLKQTITACVAVKQPLMIWGAPGIGKSRIVCQVAEEADLELRDVRATLLDACDLRGLPSVDGGVTRWNPPCFLPTSGRGILFIDELPQAPMLVQCALFQLILDRKLGEYSLPDSWAVVAAGNRETDRAGAGRMPTALANRFCHVQLEVDSGEWRLWAVGHGIDPLFIAFTAFRPALLSTFEADGKGKAFASPRTWEMLSNVWRGGLASALEFEVAAGLVGEGAAGEFVSFAKIWRQLPRPDAVLANPTQADVPTDPATLYALCGALAYSVRPETAGALCTYAGRLPAEFSVLLLKDVVVKLPALIKVREFALWAAAHKDILI